MTWHHCFHLVRMHLDAGEVLRQGEDLRRWVQSVVHHIAINPGHGQPVGIEIVSSPVAVLATMTQ